MASYFVTGSSRGIGLGIVQSLAQAPAADVGKGFASARTETPALTNLVSDPAGRFEFIGLDVTSEQSVRKAVQTVERSLGGQALDVLINNAGIMNHTPKGGEN
ncbi:Short-chain dehydrogenase/reductase SDR, partial [Macrophomina phaseolina MS6]